MWYAFWFVSLLLVGLVVVLYAKKKESRHKDGDDVFKPENKPNRGDASRRNNNPNERRPRDNRRSNTPAPTSFQEDKVPDFLKNGPVLDYHTDNREAQGGPEGGTWYVPSSPDITAAQERKNLEASLSKNRAPASKSSKSRPKSPATARKKPSGGGGSSARKKPTASRRPATKK